MLIIWLVLLYICRTLGRRAPPQKGFRPWKRYYANQCEKIQDLHTSPLKDVNNNCRYLDNTVACCVRIYMGTIFIVF